MIFTLKFKKCVASTGIFGVIIYKLRYWQKLCPIILLKINKSLEVDFHHTISSLNLAIYLRIESRW